MEISGQFKTGVYDGHTDANNAFYKKSYISTNGGYNEYYGQGWLGFAASRTWTGYTSTTKNSSGTDITNTQNQSANHTHSYQGGVETNPINVTMKLWKRTA